MPDFGAQTTTDEVLEGVDLTGRRALVTGATSGLGVETARALASVGAAVTLAGRDPAALAETTRRLSGMVDGADLDTLVLDLASLASVRAAAAEWLERHDRLDLLVNNAGIMCCPQGTTVDGFELQLGTNHLGHFLLTGLLLPALEAAAPARVVNLSSGGHGIDGVDFDDPMFERRPYDPWVAYGQSKTANVLFTVELERRHGGRGIHAYAVHPGMIMTNLGRHLTPETMAQLNERRSERASEGTALEFKSVEAGAATTVWAATSPDLEGRGGRYLADCQLGVEGGDTGSTGVAPHALDPVAARRLWELSESLTGVAY